MLTVPVLDLQRGQVVRAMRGERAAYRPIESRLATGAAPAAVARALCAACGARQLYVADLDALQGGAVQLDALRVLRAALPQDIELWLDAGFADSQAAARVIAAVGPLRPVFASESLASRQALQAACAGRDDVVLSLDRRSGERLDRAGCWDSPALWPTTVIVMTLERVGTHRGPDLDTLREVQARSPATRLVGAGGIRDASDLAQAQQAGAWAWLVASALHDGRLGRPAPPG